MAHLYRIHQFLLPAANFSGDGTRPVGAGGLGGPYGVFDMPGNVREWCWNATAMGRCIRGGAWNDAIYMYRDVTHASPFDRSSKNGFRCMQLASGSTPPPEVFKPIEHDEPYDLRAVERVSDDVYEVYREHFSYDRGSLQATVESRDESAEDWVKEKISFNALSPGERMSAYLFLPTNALPPYQTVVYFPGAAAQMVSSSDGIDALPEFKRNIRFLLKSGRAVLHPITIAMYERMIPDSIWDAMGLHQHADYRIRLVQEYRRSVDYLETRPDIDTSKLAFLGFSWGGFYGPLVLAVEKRFDVAILQVGGLSLESDVRPEVRITNHVTRVTTPVLMLNGGYDMFFPLELQVKPMYDLLGTPQEHKSLKLYPTDHFIPIDELVKESLAWLDKYL
ncbi:MAG: SUMF1/EgtB/PvdO family nonheme iron enzyme, partial [Bacteroidetes bacterium]|nr:SUMF1/EgtB/PvdO family nonheme iron enzyme [Bacteroidota bacterium]